MKMKKSWLNLYTSIFTLTITMNSIDLVLAQESKMVVRLARLKIELAQLENYKIALKEEIETSIRVEPGVVTLNAVAEKKDPTNVTILEIYLDDDAYNKHLETPHFKKYKTTTKDMVKSIELTQTDPIILGTKKR